MSKFTGLVSGVVLITPLNLVEIFLLTLCFRLAFDRPRLGGFWFSRAEAGLARLARKPNLAKIVVGLLPLIVRARLLPLFPIREPVIHDEFSYLLAGDTFALGRLTNPTHPMWVHFGTLHIIPQPTYSSLYPVAQGVVLAPGKVLFGHPWVGACLTRG